LVTHHYYYFDVSESFAVDASVLIIGSGPVSEAEVSFRCKKEVAIIVFWRI
jgi:hypothetical protein